MRVGDRKQKFETQFARPGNATRAFGYRTERFSTRPPRRVLTKMATISNTVSNI